MTTLITTRKKVTFHPSEMEKPEGVTPVAFMLKGKEYYLHGDIKKYQAAISAYVEERDRKEEERGKTK